jgi:hypothetical protein
MGVFGWNVLADYAVLHGTVTETRRADDGDWILMVQPDPSSSWLLQNSHGTTNENGQVECEVEPSDFFDDDLHEQIYFGPLQGRQVTVVGTWAEDLSHSDKTEIHPITSVCAERTFNDSKTVYLTVMADDSGRFPANVPHSGESRVGDFRILFPPVPVVPHYDHKPKFTIEMSKSYTRSADFWIEDDGTHIPVLRGMVHTGTAGEGHGLYIARIYLSYESIPKFIPVDVIPGGARLQITSVEYTNHRSQRGPQHARFISAVGGYDGGVFWKMMRETVMYLMRSGQKTFFTEAPDGTEAEVQIVEPHRTAHDVYYYPYIATVADDTVADNLSALPLCPMYTDEL